MSESVKKEQIIYTWKYDAEIGWQLWKSEGEEEEKICAPGVYILKDGIYYLGVYETEDKEVSKIMAEAVKKITCCDIAIGTTAGIGRGGISVVTNDCTIITTSDVTSDLRENNSEELFQRQENGIEKCIKIVLFLLNDDFDSIKSMNNVEIIEN